jgi:hypothetical protein
MILLVGFTGASILAIFIFIVIGKTTKPVSKISEVLELVAAGNLGAAVTKTAATAKRVLKESTLQTNHQKTK